MTNPNIRAVFPVPSVDSAPFWEACDKETLLLQRCNTCQTPFYYARRLCPHCGSEDLAWVPSTGTGRIFSFSEVRISFFGPEWDDQLPYTVALIDLDDGPRMLTRLMLQPGQQPDIGDPVSVTFVDIEGRKLPFFTLQQANRNA